MHRTIIAITAVTAATTASIGAPTAVIAGMIVPVISVPSGASVVIMPPTAVTTLPITTSTGPTAAATAAI